MIDIIILMLPIFSMIAIGSLFLHQGWFPPEGLPILNKFVMNACIPALLFSAVTGSDSFGAEAWRNAALYAGASLLGSFLLWVILRLVLKGHGAQSVILAMGAATANSVFLGFPILTIFMPDSANEVFAWIIIAEIAFIIPIMTTLALMAEDRDDTSVGPLLMAFLRSPVAVGLFAGFGFRLTGLDLPDWTSQVIKSIVSATPFIALFVVGGTMLQNRLTRSGPRVLAVSAAKLFLQPALVAVAFGLLIGWDTDATKGAIVFATMPLFLSLVAFASRHEVEDVAASSIVLTTLLGAVTVTLTLSVLF